MLRLVWHCLKGAGSKAATCKASLCSCKYPCCGSYSPIPFDQWLMHLLAMV